MTLAAKTAAVLDLLNRTTYKSGAYFTAWPDPSGAIRVMVQREVDDSTGKWAPGSGPLLQAQSTILVLNGVADADIQDYVTHKLRQLVHGLELHEADEWLKLDGVLLNDPHKERQPAI